MMGSSGARGLAWSGAGRAAPGKGARQVKVAKSCGASQSDVASGCAGQRALQKLVDEMIQLGHIPTQSKKRERCGETSRAAVEQGTQGGLLDKGAGGSFGEASADK